MSRYIALLRGINVGGNNILRMKDLRGLLGDLGFENVATYIQSGNCIFDSDLTDAAKISDMISAVIGAQFGFTPKIMTLLKGDFAEILKAVPYAQASDDPKSVHIFFLSSPAKNADLDVLECLKKDSEDFTLTDKAFYLYAPEGIGRSKLAAGAEKKLGVAATARNFRSALKIAELADS